MRILSESSYRRLAAAGTQLELLEEKHTRLAVRFRMLEKKHQELVLLVGLEGMTVEVKPPIPAQPERLALKSKRGPR